MHTICKLLQRACKTSGPFGKLLGDAAAYASLATTGVPCLSVACLCAHVYANCEFIIGFADLCADTGIKQVILTHAEARAYLLAAIVAVRCLRHPSWANGVVLEYAVNPANPTVRLFSCFPTSPSVAAMMCPKPWWDQTPICPPSETPIPE